MAKSIYDDYTYQWLLKKWASWTKDEIGGRPTWIFDGMRFGTAGIAFGLNAYYVQHV